MKTVFHPEAEEEFITAVRQYSDIDPSLGADFEAKVEEGVLLALMFPSMWREIRPGLRRVLIRRFPYGIIVRLRRRRLLHLGSNASSCKTRILEGQDERFSIKAKKEIEQTRETLTTPLSNSNS